MPFRGYAVLGSDGDGFRESEIQIYPLFEDAVQACDRDNAAAAEQGADVRYGVYQLTQLNEAALFEWGVKSFVSEEVYHCVNERAARSLAVPNEPVFRRRVGATQWEQA